jgi:hypothetical protein
MSEARTSRATTAGVQATGAESQPEASALKWGEPPPPERIAELEARLAAWEQLPAEARGDPAKQEGRSAFDRVGPQAWDGGPLTGADVFYLAARTLAGGSAEPQAFAAAERLRTTDLSERLYLDLSALHVESARSSATPTWTARSTAAPPSTRSCGSTTPC